MSYNKQWTAKEDKKLRNLVETTTSIKWNEIAFMHNFGRSGKQCRERYINQLDPSINWLPFTYEEDITILEWQLIVGNRWTFIMKKLSGRTANQIKNRYNSLIKKSANHQKYIPQLTGSKKKRCTLQMQRLQSKALQNSREKKTSERRNAVALEKLKILARTPNANFLAMWIEIRKNEFFR